LKKTSKLFKALSDETRLRILKMLEARPLCVCEIQHVLKGSQPNVSHHLKTARFRARAPSPLAEKRRAGEKGPGRREKRQPGRDRPP
jgi:DNA-binding transcriptional ArsR family regulator